MCDVISVSVSGDSADTHGECSTDVMNSESADLTEEERITLEGFY